LACPDSLFKGRLQGPREGAWLSFANRLSVDADDGTHFLHRTGDKHLIHPVQLRVGDGFFPEFQADRIQQAQNYLPGDAVQDEMVGRVGVTHAVPDAEQVGAAALSHGAVAHEDGLVGACFVRLLFGEDVGKQVDGLDVHPQPADVFRRDSRDPLFQMGDGPLNRGQVAGENRLRRCGKQMSAGGDAASELDVDDPALNTVFSDQLADVFAQPLQGDGQRDANRLGTGCQPPQVRFQFKRHPVIKTNHFVDAVPKLITSVFKIDAKQMARHDGVIVQNVHQALLLSSSPLFPSVLFTLHPSGVDIVHREPHMSLLYHEMAAQGLTGLQKEAGGTCNGVRMSLP